MSGHVQTLDEPRAETDRLTRGEIFTVLSNRRRRWVLHALKRCDDRRVDLRTLVDRLSSWEYDAPPDELPWKKRKRIYTALRQSHLPKLAEAGAIEYDRNRGEVRLTDDAHELQLYLEYAPSDDIAWSRYYLALSTIAATIPALAWYSVYPFTELSGVVLATALVAPFVGSAVAHAYSVRRNRLDAEGKPP